MKRKITPSTGDPCGRPASNESNISKTDSGIWTDGFTAILPRSNAAVCIMAANPRENKQIGYDSKYFEELRTNNYIVINGYKISPNGPANTFPTDLRRLLDADNNMHGMLRTKIDLLLAGGTFLYRPIIVGEGADRQIVREPVFDNEIEDWLEECNFLECLLQAAVDFTYTENVFTQFVRNRFARLEGFRDKWRLTLKTINAEDCRLEVMDGNGKINHVFVADWLDPESRNIPAWYPMFDKSEPWKSPAAMWFGRFPSFASKYYGRPQFVGAEKYISLAGLIPYWHQDNIQNAQFKWHVEVSADWWSRLLAEERVPSGSKEELEFQTKFLEAIDSTLFSSTAENAAKRIHSRFTLNSQGQPVPGLKITALEDNTDKNSKAYLDLYQTVDNVKISAVGLDPALSNTYKQGKLSSGSEKMHAFNIHTKVVAPIPRRIILGPWNCALAANFPTRSDIRIGFRDVELNTQDKGKEGFKDSSTDAAE